MVRALLIRGMLAGVVAGLLAFGLAKLSGEPQVDRAIAFEEQMEKAHAAGTASMSGSMSMSSGTEMPSAEPELVSRAVQAGLGLFTGVVVYGTAFGGLFALVFAYAYGRIGPLSPRATSALLAAGAFLVLVVVPDIKYPANPPAVGDADSIGERTRLFLAMIAIGIAALVLAILVARRFTASLGGWNACLVGGAVFIVVVAIAQVLLPAINEVPDQFPAVVLWRFRIASLGIEAVLWATIGLLFGALAEPLLHKGRWSPAYA